MPRPSARRSFGGSWAPFTPGCTSVSRIRGAPGSTRTERGRQARGSPIVHSMFEWKPPDPRIVAFVRRIEKVVRRWFGGAPGRDAGTQAGELPTNATREATAVHDRDAPRD